jgi:hypothetical protein
MYKLSYELFSAELTIQEMFEQKAVKALRAVSAKASTVDGNICELVEDALFFHENMMSRKRRSTDV